MGVDIDKTYESCIHERLWIVPERGVLRSYRIFPPFSSSLFLDPFLFFCASETGFTSAPGRDRSNLSCSQNLVAARTQKQFERFANLASVVLLSFLTRQKITSHVPQTSVNDSWIVDIYAVK